MPPKTDLKTSTPTIMVSRSETNANNTVTNTPNQDGKGSKKLRVFK
ncbi:MAG: hypothetical protein RLZZ210_527 [Pseudomonadota bacterium]